MFNRAVERFHPIAWLGLDGTRAERQSVLSRPKMSPEDRRDYIADLVLSYTGVAVNGANLVVGMMIVAETLEKIDLTNIATTVVLVVPTALGLGEGLHAMTEADRRLDAIDQKYHIASVGQPSSPG